MSLASLVVSADVVESQSKPVCLGDCVISPRWRLTRLSYAEIRATAPAEPIHPPDIPVAVQAVKLANTTLASASTRTAHVTYERMMRRIACGEWTRRGARMDTRATAPRRSGK